MTLPADHTRRPSLPGPRQRGAPAHHAACPEWTEHNVSDPGITLIELFAWMTEMLIYRRQPHPREAPRRAARAARHRPRAADRRDERHPLPAGRPADGDDRDPGRRDGGGNAAHGQRGVDRLPDERGLRDSARAADRLRGREGQAREAGGRSLGEPPSRRARTSGRSGRRRRSATRSTSASTSSLARLLLQLDVDCSQARGAGVDPEDPPLRWEVSPPSAGGWEEADGARRPHGRVQLRQREHRAPAAAARTRSRASADSARTGFVVASTPTRAPAARRAAYQHPPEIYSLTAAPIGALIPASHAARRGGRGRRRERRHAGPDVPAPRIAGARAGRRRGARGARAGSGRLGALGARRSFVESGPDDRHYMLDLATASSSSALRSGPQKAAGASTAPCRRRERILRFTRYRHGGGRQRQRRAGTLIDTEERDPGRRVGHEPGARSGRGRCRDARQRAPARGDGAPHAPPRGDRAKTSSSSPAKRRSASRGRIASPPGDGGPVRLHILPRVEPADRRLEYDELVPDEALFEEVPRTSTSGG